MPQNDPKIDTKSQTLVIRDLALLETGTKCHVKWRQNSLQVKPRLNSCSNWSSCFHSLFEPMNSKIHRGQHSFAILENKAQSQSISRGMITLVRSVKSVAFKSSQ